MKPSFVAGFGPVVRDPGSARTWWQSLGIEMEELGADYWGTDELDGVKAFALWPLSQAAENTFGSTDWPADILAPQAWIELDVDSAAAVAEAEAELRASGHQVLRETRDEPWGQTTCRLLSPEGLLVGIAHTPWMHRSDEPGDGAPTD